MIYLYDRFVWTWSKFRGEKQCRKSGGKIRKLERALAGGEEKT
jgi:hypothetical protein